MSKERELIDKYNYLIDCYNNSSENNDATREIEKEAFNTLYSISEYMKNNTNNIEDQDLLDRTMIKGINNIYYSSDRYKKPIDISPLSYQKTENSRVMIISDLHYISRNIGDYRYHKDSLNYVYSALYCVDIFNINEIIILGDLIDGRYYKPDVDYYIRQKTIEDFYNEMSFITDYIRKQVPNIKIRVVLGNHDINAINDYRFKYRQDINKGFEEYMSIFKDTNIKLDGLGEVLYEFGNNKLLLEHDINKPFGLYNPLEIEYKNEYEYEPTKYYRSISGHGHLFKRRFWYQDNQTDISNVMCPCLKGDYIDYEGDTYSIGFPGFLIVESSGDKIIVEPYFINKIGNKYNVDTLDNLYERSINKESGISPKYGKYNYDKKIVLEKIIN